MKAGVRLKFPLRRERIAYHRHFHLVPSLALLFWPCLVSTVSIASSKTQVNTDSKAPPSLLLATLMSLLSSSSPSLPEVQQVAEDCPICLDEMSPADVLHPVQCRCGYNFCAGCIESLITSSKDDYQEASDGNLHVKVFLHCPNCRSDLGGSIRDTLLCRKVCNLEEHTTTDELTQSEMRLQQVLDDPEVKLAIREAQQRQDDFFGKKPARPPPEKQNSFHMRVKLSRK